MMYMNSVPPFDNPQKSIQKNLLILDLDETLVYSSEYILDRNPDFCVGKYFVYTRPGLDLFLSTCSQLYEVAVWTFGSQDYACEIIDSIFPGNVHLHFVFDNERCIYRFNHELGRYEIIKPLKKVRRKGFTLDKVLVVDDNSDTFQYNYGNAILVSKYYGDIKDSELFALTKYLSNIYKVNDVRKIEKRGWRSKISD
jgi:carboxy-terminal domain RNA polymerase II polypeptide A small phosphatase